MRSTTRVPAVAISFALVCASGGHAFAQDAADDIRTILNSLEGFWSGVLEYQDYQSDRRVELPTRLEWESFDTELSARRLFAFTDPGRVIESGDLVRFDTSGEQASVLIIPADDALDAVQRGMEMWTVSSWRVDDAASWTITLERAGSDDGRPALLRLTQRLEDGRFSSLKEVDYTDDDVEGRYEFRNEVRLERSEPDADELVGSWIIDLRPTPDAAPYTMRLEVESVADGGLTGTFYGGSPISNARLNTDWGAVRFAFTTSDGSGVYHTQGTLRGGRLEGATHAVGRGFLGVWSGRRAE